MQVDTSLSACIEAVRGEASARMKALLEVVLCRCASQIVLHNEGVCCVVVQSSTKCVQRHRHTRGARSTHRSAVLTASLIVEETGMPNSKTTPTVRAAQAPCLCHRFCLSQVVLDTKETPPGLPPWLKHRRTPCNPHLPWHTADRASRWPSRDDRSSREERRQLFP